MSNKQVMKLRIDQISDLLILKEVFIGDGKSGIEIHGAEGSIDLSKNFIDIIDYIINNEETSFCKNCECDIDITGETSYKCNCDANKNHPYKKAIELYYLINN